MIVNGTPAVSETSLIVAPMAVAVTGTSDGIFLNYSIEAQDVANSGWNYTSSSSFVTLSFWVKSSVAQNFYG